MDRNQPNTTWSVAAYRMWSAAAISWMSWPMSYAQMAKQLAGGRKIGDKSEKKSISKAASASAPVRESKSREASIPPAVETASDTGIARTEPSAPASSPPTARAPEMPERNASPQPQSASMRAQPVKESVSHAPPANHGKADKKRKHQAKGPHGGKSKR